MRTWYLNDASLYCVDVSVVEFLGTGDRQWLFSRAKYMECRISYLLGQTSFYLGPNNCLLVCYRIVCLGSVAWLMSRVFIWWGVDMHALMQLVLRLFILDVPSEECTYEIWKTALVNSQRTKWCQVVLYWTYSDEFTNEIASIPGNRRPWQISVQYHCIIIFPVGLFVWER